MQQSSATWISSSWKRKSLNFMSIMVAQLRIIINVVFSNWESIISFGTIIEFINNTTNSFNLENGIYNSSSEQMLVFNCGHSWCEESPLAREISGSSDSIKTSLAFSIRVLFSRSAEPLLAGEYVVQYNPLWSMVRTSTECFSLQGVRMCLLRHHPSSIKNKQNGSCLKAHDICWAWIPLLWLRLAGSIYIQARAISKCCVQRRSSRQFCKDHHHLSPLL